MKIWTYKTFVPVVCILFLGLFTYAIIGLVLNSWILTERPFHGRWPLNERCGIVVLMVTEVLFVAATLVGIGGVVRRSVIIWYLPGFILLGTGVAMVAFGVVTFREAGKDLTLEIFKEIQTSNGSRAEENFQWISTVQWEHDCCGVISYKDYLLFNFTGLATQSVPDTCCNRKEKIPMTNCGHDLLVPGKSTLEIESLVMTNGCGPVMSKLQNETLHKLGMELFIVGSLSLALSVFVFVGILSLVAIELGDLDETEESGPDPGSCLSPAMPSSTTGPNTPANPNVAGVLRNVANRRIFRTRRHGGGESIVSFAVDFQNNNVGGRPTVPDGRIRTGDKVRVKGRVNARRFVKVKGQGSSRGPPTVSSGYLKSSTETLEMLLKPRDNHSILSTTPCPSSQNFMGYFRQGQDQGSKVIDSDTNLRHQGVQPKLTHYSSLPQVQSPVGSSVCWHQPDADARAAMAELKQRFPPRGTSVQPRRSHSPPPIPPATSQTQHHHYYRIPPLPMGGPTPPTVSHLSEATLDTIQEEGESTASTLLPPPEPDQHVSIFEVFDELNPQTDSASGGDTVEPLEVTSTRIHPLDSDDSVPAHEPSSVMVINEEDIGVVESGMNLPNCKIEPEPIDALVYFQV